MSDETKRCSRCEVVKPLSEFSKNIVKGRNYGSSKCKPCHKAYRLERYTPRLRRWEHLKYKYGLSPEDYNRMLEEQNHVCAICHKPESVGYKGGEPAPLAVDHCHTTGKVRGLLCNHCNTALGKFKDDPALLHAAIDYLSNHFH